MGIDRTDYIVYGWKLPFKLKNESGEINILDDKFLPFIEGRPGVDYLISYDGMGGKYIVFGKKLLSCDEYEGSGWDFKDISIGIEDLDSKNLKDKFKELFEMNPEVEPKLFIYSHFS